jgi:hypothetical protein
MKTLKRMYVIKKVGFRYRQAEIAGIAVVERFERTVGITSAVRWLRNAHVAEHFGVEKPTQKLQSFTRFALPGCAFVVRVSPWGQECDGVSSSA